MARPSTRRSTLATAAGATTSKRAASSRGRPRAWLPPTSVGNTRKRWPPAVRLQGAAPWPGLSLARAVAGRSGRQQGQHPRKAASPARKVPSEGNGYGDGQRGKWLGHLF
ncbi:hypothetical protein BHE74_00045494 [Ensete ventricosum]|nr:hypothetical protein BHE74_00045494 [Ensete ventricosum]